MKRQPWRWNRPPIPRTARELADRLDEKDRDPWVRGYRQGLLDPQDREAFEAGYDAGALEADRIQHELPEIAAAIRDAEGDR